MDNIFPTAVPDTSPSDDTILPPVNQDQARSNVIISHGANPEQAAKSLAMSKDLGVSPGAVYNDFDNFSKIHSVGTNASLVANNPMLGAYINSNPMAAKVSADDLPQLDVISEAVKKHNENSILVKGVKGFLEGFGSSGLGGSYFSAPKNIEEAQASGAGGALAAGVSLVGAVPETVLRVAGGALTGTTRAVEQAYRSATGQEPEFGEQFLRVISDPGTWASAGFPDPLATLHANLLYNAALRAEIGKVSPYVEAGKVPPVGSHPLVDEIHSEQAKLDLDNLNDILKEVGKSQTHELAPQHFEENFLSKHPEMQGDIGIGSDAIRELYDEKQPTLGDKKLGDLITPEQLAVAEMTGGDVQVPVAKYLSAIADNPEIHKELEDSIRARPEGMTVEETKEAPPITPVTPSGDTAVDAVRQAAALEPLPVVEEPAPVAPSPDAMVRREGPSPKPTQLELPQAGTTRMEDRPPAEPGALGLTKVQFERFQKLIAERREQDVEAIKSKILAAERRRQTVEWKENASALRPEVVDQVNARPDVATMNALEEQNWKINPKTLTDEQKALIPKRFLDKNGVAAQDLADFAGAQGLDHMVQGYANLAADRGDMKSFTYRRQLIDQEVARQMTAKYGDKEQNILQEAKDQVLSTTQEELLHEQTMALAEKAGQEYTISKEAIRAQAMEMIGDTPIKGFTSDKYLAEAGRAGRAMQDGFLKKDYAEAFRQQQRQYLSMIFGREAKGIDALREKFDAFAKKFAKREVPNVPQEYTNYIHDMLMRTGQSVRRTAQDLQEEIGRVGYKSFDAFIDAKEPRDLHVPDWMRDANFKKNLDDLSVNEFKEYTDALKAMEHNGRDELKMDREGDKVDLDKVKAEMLEKIKSIGPGTVREFKKEKKFSKDTGRATWWSGITAETMLDRLDRGNAKGIFTQTMTRMFSQASNSKDRLIRDYKDKLAVLGDIPDMDKKVDNFLFKDPFTGDFIPMRKRNVLGILQNAGNKSNLTKLAKGYGLEPEEVMNWLHTSTTVEDWNRAQKIGNTFEELFQLANTMSHSISGVGIQRIQLQPIDTAFGQFPGWYNPVKYDQLRPGTSAKLLGKSQIEQEGFFKATTPQGYTKERTGYIAPVELSLDIVPQRMRQMIHDIAFRPTVLQLSKIIHDKDIQSALNAHYSPLVTDSLKTFLHDIANAGNFQSWTASLGNQAMEVLRQNTIATLIGFNPSTVLKHGPTAAINSMTQVGLVNFAREFSTLAMTDPLSGKTNWGMAMDKSEELMRRLRTNFTQLIQNRDQELSLARTSYRDFMISAGATPVSISDLLSAVPTWLAEYKKQIALGEDEGQSVFLADRAVRRAHGSSTLTNRPEIMRTAGPLASTFTSLYGFFSHMMQRQYEMGWKAKDMLKDVLGSGSGDAEMATRHAPDIMKGFFSYIIAPALIEELVTPYSNKDKESWGLKAAKVLGLGLSSSMIGVRDFVHGLINLQDPNAGLLSTSMKAGMDVARDLHHPSKLFTRQGAGNTIKHTATLVGVTTGLTNAQEGRTLEFMQRYSAGLEHPKGPWGALVGTRYGTLKGHSGTLNEYARSLTR